MRPLLLILVSVVISLSASAQGVTSHGQDTTAGNDFVNKRGRIVSVPALSRFGQELDLATISTTPVSSITITSAISGGDITNGGGTMVISRGVCWSTSVNPTIADSKTTDGSGLGTFTSYITGLTSNTIYYVRTYATNGSGTNYGQEFSFQTADQTIPGSCLVAWYPFNGNANDKSGIGNNGTVNGATLTTDRFGNPNTAYYFNGSNNSITIPGYLPITNSFTISFWAYLENTNGYSTILTDGGINYGGNDFLINFRNNDIGIRADKAGNPLNYEYDSPTQLTNLNLVNRWVHVTWVMKPAGSIIYLNGAQIAEITVTGTNEGYHDDHVTIGARHVWTNMDSYFKGKLDDIRIYNCSLTQQEIIALYGEPVTTTITHNLGLNVNPVDAGKVTGAGNYEAGEMVSITAIPAKGYQFVNWTLDGAIVSSSDTFLYAMPAENATLTANFEVTGPTWTACPDMPTVTDIDGNVYNTIHIGDQCWLQENLKTTRYRDGSAIEYPGADIAAWQNNTTGAYAWYNNDEATYKTNGALYNWYAVNTGKLCPSGWHVATYPEWNILTDYLANNGYGYEGTGTDIAKSLASTTGWTGSSTPGTPGNDPLSNNSSGFAGIPAGCRSIDGNFYYLGETCQWWTAQELETYWTRYISFNQDNVLGYPGVTKTIATPVRCLYGEEPALPSITTVPASSITQNTAVTGGDITSDGGAVITSRGICWSTSSNPTIADNATADSSGTGVFISHITGLKAKTIYYIRAFATNNKGTGYGEELSFITADSTMPDECLIAWYPFNGNADDASGIANDGTVNGAVLADDRFGNPNSAYYFNGVNNSITIPGYLAITDSFTISFWAYLEKTSGYSNILTDGGINYGGNDFLINFRNNDIGIRADKAGRPLNYEYNSPAGLTNLNLINRWVHVVWIMNPSGSIIYLNGDKIAEVNVAGTNEGYHDDHVTIGARHVWTSMDNYFQGKLDDIRVYNCILSQQEIGVLYNELYDTVVTPSSCGTVTDIDGNVYNTVTIGTQCWMKENLRTTKYQNGDLIPNVAFGNNWSALNTGAWAYYQNNNQYNYPYGKLYNWHVVEDNRNVCPENWHVPSYDEMIVLTDYLGGQDSAGNKMKIYSAQYWNRPDIQWTNESGFSALPGGSAPAFGSYWALGNQGAWWSSTEVNERAWILYLEEHNDYDLYNTLNKKQGFSIRCVKDEDLELPTVITKPVTSITQTTATAGGSTTSDGGDTIIACGVCWSTSDNPTIADNKTSEVADTGSFTSSITGLTAGTTYYLRAYATNSVGTAYGDQLSFTTAAYPNKYLFRDTTSTGNLFTGYAANLIKNTFSYDLWVKPTRTINMAGESNVCMGGVSVPLANSNQNWAILANNGGLGTGLGVGLTIGTNGIMVGEHTGNVLVSRLSYPVSITDWVHVAVVYRPDSIFLYLNGNKVRSRKAPCTATIFASNCLSGSVYSPQFKGNLDEFRLWDIALTPQEVQIIKDKKLMNQVAGLRYYVGFDNGEFERTLGDIGNVEMTVTGLTPEQHLKTSTWDLDKYTGPTISTLTPY